MKTLSFIVSVHGFLRKEQAMNANVTGGCWRFGDSFIALIVFAVLIDGIAYGQDEAGVAQLQLAISSWHRYTQFEDWPDAGWEWEYFGGNDIPRPRTSNAWADGSYRFTQAKTKLKGQEYEGIGLLNTDYGARIVRERGNDWRIESVIGRNQPGFDALRKGIDRTNGFLQPLVFHPLTLLDVFSDPSSYSITSFEVIEDSELGSLNQFIVSISNGQSINGVDAFLEEVRLKLAPEKHFLPMEFVAVMNPPGVGKYERRASFTKWRRIDDRWYWGEYEWTENHLSNNKKLLVEKGACTFDFEGKAKSRQNYKKCRLSHYGLPEPEISRPSNGKYFLLANAALVVVLVVLLLRRR